MGKRAATLAIAAMLASAGCLTSPPLFEAAYRGDSDQVDALLRQGADLIEATARGWTPLMIAAAEGHAEVVDRLVDAGANVNAQNFQGRTALMFAARYGYTAIVERLVAARADVNLVPAGEPRWPALLVASQNGYADVVRRLLANGADATYQDEQGVGAIQLAYDNGHPQLGELLIESWPGSLYQACLPHETEQMRVLGKADPKLVAHFNCRADVSECETNPDGELCQRVRDELGLGLPARPE